MKLIQDYINNGKIEEFGFTCIRGYRCGEIIAATVFPHELRVEFIEGYKNKISPSNPYSMQRILHLDKATEQDTIICSFTFDFSVWEAELPFNLKEG